MTILGGVFVLPADVLAQCNDTLIGDVNIPCDDDRSTADTVRDILTTIYAIAGFVTVIILVIGGGRFVVAGGNPENVASARRTILYSLIGLLVVVFAWGITIFVLDVVSGDSDVINTGLRSWLA